MFSLNQRDKNAHFIERFSATLTCVCDMTTVGKKGKKCFLKQDDFDKTAHSE